MSARTPTVLDRIVGETRVELVRRKREHPLSAGAGTAAATDGPRRFHDALAVDGIGVIAEFKRRSPSAGALHEAPELSDIVRAYERGGAVAVSVLTEGPNFGGSLDDLRAARSACGLPLLRKDFVVDEYQLHEARQAGADAVLLIVAVLEQDELCSLHATAREIGLDALVEVHDREELSRALELGADIVGINNRDLRDFSVDIERTARLMDDMPPGTIVVSESGIARAEQLSALRARGVQAVLVGESLMRAADPAAALADLRSFRHADADL